MFLLKLCKLLLFLLIFILIIAGCSTPISPTPTVTPTIIERTEIPSELLSFKTITEFKLWLWNNYNYLDDEYWSGYKDYPLTPAEWYMSCIRDANSYNRIIEKRPYIGDCEDYAGLAAYFLWRALGYDAYVGVIPNFSEPNISHMICFGFGSLGDFVVVNAPWVSTRYKSIEEYMHNVYPDKRVVDIMPIETYLEDLYAKGHHRYWDEEI